MPGLLQSILIQPVPSPYESQPQLYPRFPAEDSDTLLQHPAYGNGVARRLWPLVQPFTLSLLKVYWRDRRRVDDVIYLHTHLHHSDIF